MEKSEKIFAISEAFSMQPERFRVGDDFMRGETKIKVCINPQCDEVAINCPSKEVKCRNCGLRLVTINKKTFDKKFKNSNFIIDYSE